MEALRLDENLFGREGHWWCTSIVHVTGGRHHTAVGGSAGIASVLWGFAALTLTGVWVREVPNGYLFHAVSHPLIRLCSCSIR